MNRTQLQKELRQAGANPSEIRELVPIAADLSQLKNTTASKSIATKVHDHWLQILKPAAFTAAGLLAGILLIVSAQSASPTSWLYPVQKLSDSAAVSFHPQYRMNVMMKRAQQVNELVASHASSKLVLATLADYTHEANAYKSMPQANYAAFEYCKDNLQRAAQAATPNVSQAITASLAALENT